MRTKRWFAKFGGTVHFVINTSLQLVYIVEFELILNKDQTSTITNLLKTFLKPKSYNPGLKPHCRSGAKRFCTLSSPIITASLVDLSSVRRRKDQTDMTAKMLFNLLSRRRGEKMDADWNLSLRAHIFVHFTFSPSCLTHEDEKRITQGRCCFLSVIFRRT